MGALAARRGGVIGWGDELIVTGQARLLQAASRKKVLVRDRNGAERHHEAWANNPRIIGRNEAYSVAHELVNGPGVRPYIAAKSQTRWSWREWECPVGEIYFSDSELAAAATFPAAVVIEPNNKQKASPNKDWGRERWQRLADLMARKGIEPVQLGPAGTQVLRGSRLVPTPSVRIAAVALSVARAVVLPEGGLHHTAAALGVPSVVIFGGYISPRQTGYATQTNLFTGGTACGMRVPCEHCAAAMAAIRPEEVFERLTDVLRAARITA